MDTQGIIEKILADAGAEAEKINTEAKQELSSRQTSLANQLKLYRDESKSLAGQATEDKKSHILAAARMDVARQQLTEKRALLEEVFDKATEQLTNLADEEYKDLMKKLMVESAETGDEEVVVDTNEKRIDHEFIKQVNRELGPGFKGNLRLSDERTEIGGGFVLKRGRIRNNVSVSVLIDKARKELEADLANELFETV